MKKNKLILGIIAIAAMAILNITSNFSPTEVMAQAETQLHSYQTGTKYRRDVNDITLFCENATTQTTTNSGSSSSTTTTGNSSNSSVGANVGTTGAGANVSIGGGTQSGTSNQSGQSSTTTTTVISSEKKTVTGKQAICTSDRDGAYTACTPCTSTCDNISGCPRPTVPAHT